MGLTTADWVLLMFRMALDTRSSVADALEREIQTTTEKISYIKVNVYWRKLTEYLSESCRQDFAWHIVINYSRPPRRMVQ